MLRNCLSKNTDNISRTEDLLSWMLTLFNQKIDIEEFQGMVIIWANELQDLTTEELRIGREWVRNSSERFMPSLPLFRARCKGLLNEHEAFILAATHKEKENLAVYYTLQELKKFCSFDAMTLVQQKREFSTQYNLICRDVIAGKLNLRPILENDSNVEEEKEMSKEDRKRIGDKYINIIKNKFFNNKTGERYATS